MKKIFITLVFSLAPFIVQASVLSCQNQNLQNEFNADRFENFLDCLTRDSELSKLGAQWLVLRKSKWEIQEVPLSKNSVSYKHQFSNNPYNPNLKNKLYLSINSKARKNLKTYLLFLENEVFPKALTGFVNDDEQGRNKTSWAFEGTAYHYTAFADLAFNKQNINREFDYWKKRENGIRKIFYPGTLIASEDFPRGWYQAALSSNLFPILQLDPIGDTYWNELRRYYNQQFVKCETSCLERQEARILQGIMMTLSHPQLVRKVHETYLNFEYSPTQQKLPRTFGCEGEFVTGNLTYNYSLTGNGYSHFGQALNLAQFGADGLLGRSLYIRGLDLSLIAQNRNKAIAGYSGDFQGQNAIIRKISPRAVQSLIELGGLGSRKLKNLSTLNGQLPHGMTQEQAVSQLLENSSFYIADYMQRRHRGENVSNHVVSNAPFFTETILSRGHSLKKWVDILYKLNPNVYYYIYGYDYGLRAAQRTILKPGSSSTTRIATKYYYDRIVQVLETEFKSIGSLF